MKLQRNRLSKNLTILLAIILGGFFLRAWRIANGPPALNWDEVSHGYNAYSILKTGKDEWGFSFPFIFRCYGDFKLPLYIYLTTLPVFFLGLTPFSVRLVSIISGAGIIIVSYFLTKRVAKSNFAGLIAAFLVAVSPWSLFLSRIAVEANLSTFLVSLGFLFWIIWERSGRTKDLLGSFLVWGLAVHSYNSARVLVPFFFLSTLFFAFKNRRLKGIILPSLFLILAFLPLVFQFVNKSAGARFYWTTLIDQGAVNRIIERRSISKLPVFFKRMMYNRPVYFLAYSIKNYFQHYSLRFLFFKGGDQYQFSLPEHGLLYLVTLPFIILGVLWSLLKKHKFLLFWGLCAFIPSAITKDSPHVLRSILVLPLPMIFSALGIFWSIEFLKKRSKFGGKLFVIVFIFSILASFSIWWRDYWKIYPFGYSWSWQYGGEEAVRYAKNYYEDYDRIVFTKKYGEPHEFILFYWPWEPSYYQQDSKKVWDYHANWYWIDAFDKFEFWNDWEIQSKIKNQISNIKNTDKKSKILLITSPGNYIEGGRRLETINFLDGSKAFEIVQYDF